MLTRSNGTNTANSVVRCVINTTGIQLIPLCQIQHKYVFCCAKYNTNTYSVVLNENASVLLTIRDLRLTHSGLGLWRRLFARGSKINCCRPAAVVLVHDPISDRESKVQRFLGEKISDVGLSPGGEGEDLGVLAEADVWDGQWAPCSVPCQTQPAASC